jgi:hypothetical protein
MLLTVNQRLDHALYAGHEPKLVVAGRIVEVTTTEREWRPRVSRIVLEIERVVQGPPSEEGRRLAVDLHSFDWPSALVRPEAGTDCALVLRREHGDQLYTVVPVDGAAAVPHARDGEHTMRILTREILSVLAKETSPARQRLLILQVAPILRADEAHGLDAYLKSGDPWLRRAALAALTYATGSEPYLRLAAEDVQRFFSTTGEDDLIDGIEPGVRYAAYPFLFEHYFFLEPRSRRFGSRWDEGEAARNDRLLRALAREGLWTAEVVRKVSGGTR